MARRLALAAHRTTFQALGAARALIVVGSAAALILAERALPLIS